MSILKANRAYLGVQPQSRAARGWETGESGESTLINAPFGGNHLFSLDMHEQATLSTNRGGGIPILSRREPCEGREI